MSNRSFCLEGKQVVVTGGAGLIGNTIARGFVDAGAAVTVVDNSEARWNALPETAKRDVHFMVGDAGSVDRLPAFVADVDAALGQTDTWVNCHYPRTDDWGGSEASFRPETWVANVEMQMVSYCVISAEIARRMAGRSAGCLINVASIYGVVGPDFSVYDGLEMTTPPPYAAIKGGIIAYSRYLATLWGPKGVRVNVVCPGGVANNQPDSFVSAYAKRTPLRRMAEPHEIAGPTVFLATPAAAYVTGTALMIDGGWTAQ